MSINGVVSLMLNIAVVATELPHKSDAKKVTVALSKQSMPSIMLNGPLIKSPVPLAPPELVQEKEVQITESEH